MDLFTFCCCLCFTAVLRNISDYTTWEWSSVNVTFNATNSCTAYDLQRNGEEVPVEGGRATVIRIDGYKIGTFTIKNVTMVYNGSNMTVLAFDDNHNSVGSSFTFHVQGENICGHVRIHIIYNTHNTYYYICCVYQYQ